MSIVLIGLLPVLLCIGCDRHQRQLHRAERSQARGDAERALVLYERASASAEADVGGRALVATAELQWEAGEALAAETRCEEAISRFPGTGAAADCLLKVADIRKVRSDWWGAIDAYREFLAQQPDAALGEDVLHEIARCYVELGDPDQALVEWTELLERHPEGARAADALLGVARCHDLAGDCGIALTVYRRVQARFPGTPQSAEAMVGEAGCLEVQGDLGQAQARYEAALAAHPNPDMVRKRLSELQESRKIREPPEP